MFLLRFMDAVWLSIALYLACQVYPKVWTDRETLASIVAVIAFALVGEAQGLYRPWRAEPVKNEVFRVWWAWGVVVPLLLLAGFVTKTTEEYSRVVSVTWFVLAPLLVSMWRLTLRLGLQELRRRGRNTRSVAAVGVSELAAQLARTLHQSPWMGMKFVGFYDDRREDRLPPVDASLGEQRGTLAQLVEDARQGKIDLVYITLPMRAEPRIQDLIRRLSDTTASVYVAYDFGGFSPLRAQWSSVGDIPVMSIVENPFSGPDGWIKRLEDLLIGCAIFLLISIPMLLISIGVKLSSPGPVFFRQRRYGLNGEQIRVLKFRTMTVCEDGESVKQATKGDARVTRFGMFLRRTSLDELPQFLQVLTGEMSIVGPRPHAVVHNEQYRSLIDGYMLRHKVKPGITGWAQVNGWRGETDTLEKMQKRVEYDLAYIRNWGLSLDIKIIWMTIVGGMGGKNAY